MPNKRVLFIRTPPYDLNFKKYNVQQVGIGKAFCNLGIDFDFVTFKKNSCKTWVAYEKNNCKCTIIEMPRVKFFRWGINSKLLSHSFLDKYDLVISQEYYQIMTYLLAKNSSRVIMYSGPYWNLFHFKLSSFIYDKLYTKRINKLINYKFTKSLLAKQFLEKKGYTNVFDIGVGLEFERYFGVNISKETKTIFNRIGDSDFLLYVGRLEKNKNTPFLLDVYEKVLIKHPNIKLVIVGKCHQSWLTRLTGKNKNAYMNSLLKKHSKLLKQNTIHVESLDNNQLQFLYSKAKAFLLPSINEIFGMVLLEAMYFGAPVISSFNGGATSLIKNERYGQIIDTFDSSEWAKAVFRYLEDPDYSSLVRKNAKENVSKNYNWDAIVQKILETIDFDL